MKWAIARPFVPSKTRRKPPARATRAWAAIALLAATGLGARSATAQELQALPPPLPPPPPSYGPGEPAAAPPQAASPASSAGEAPSEVRFEPDEPDVSLLRLSAAVPGERVASYDYERWYTLYGPICQGPCTTRLPRGAYRLALAKGGRMVPVRGPVVVDGPATLHGDYVDRSALRATGLVVGVAGAIGGFVMIIASAQNRAVCDFNGICVSDGTTDGPLLATGVAVLVVSAVVGSILTFQGDGARITVEPLVLPGHASREGGLTALRPSRPQGAALALHF
jgi:hypothetical protein